jgi:hypothetical protein
VNDLSIIITTILTGDKNNVQGANHDVSGKGKVTMGMKATDTANANTVTATSAGNRGQKRKSDLRQPEQDDASSVSHDENPPTKKGKTSLAPAVDTRPRPRPVPRPLKKKGFEAAQGEEMNQGMDPFNRRTNAKKRPSEAANMAYPEKDPKTPVPSKKAKVGLNEKSKDAPIPIRRTGKPIFFLWLNEVDKEKLETMIGLFGSKLVGRRPTNISELPKSRRMLMTKKQCHILAR